MTLCDGGLLRGNRSSGMIQIVYHSVCTVSWVKMIFKTIEREID